MSNQGGVQAAIRASTGTAYDYNGDWSALFDADGIAAGAWNGRLLAWINDYMGAAYTNLEEAKQAFAVSQGFLSWSAMSTLVLAVSAARTLAEGEAQALVLDFTDDFFFASTSQYGSCFILDTTTPANNYDSHPYGELTYTSPSAKMTRQLDGTWKFNAHNLYLNSASPANQSITVVSGGSYSVTITGTVSITASGAATGTWTAGTTTFTAATATLTLGATSGIGTVHVRRTPSVDTYLATAGAARFALPFEWSAAGAQQGILVEEARTNLFLNSTTGATQTITVVSGSTYTVSFFGTGSITFSGANSSTLNGTGATDRVSTTFVAASTSLTCTVSGSITMVNVELGAFATSPIITHGATATRAVDNIQIATSAFPYSQPSGTLIVEYYRTRAITNARIANLANGLTRVFDMRDSGVVAVTFNGTGDLTTVNALATGSVNKLAAAYATTDYAFCSNGGAVVTRADATVNTATQIYIGSFNAAASNILNDYIRKIIYLPRRMSNLELQTIST